MKVTLADVLASKVGKLNQHLIGPDKGKICLPPPSSALIVAEGLRQIGPESKLNQTEKRYLGWLRTLNDDWIGIQCVTLILASDLRFTPDFWAIDEVGIRAIDVKGKHVWEDSRIKIKVAARIFPWVRFLIATEKEGAWQHEEIKP